MASKRNSFGKRFKNIAKKNPTSFTFAEKQSRLSPTKAIDTLLNRSTNDNNNESIDDIIDAFSHKSKQYYHHNRTNKRLQNQEKRDYNYHKNKHKVRNGNIEHITKAIHPTQIIKIKPIKKPLRTLANTDMPILQDSDTEQDTLEQSSKPNHKKRKLNQSNSKSENPNKKQKQIFTNIWDEIDTKSDAIIPENIPSPKDHYSLHWNTRFTDRNKEIKPILQRRRGNVMSRMEITANNYICFIDKDCEPFAVSKRINNPSLHCHSDIIASYAIRNKQSLKSAKKYTPKSDLFTLTPMNSLLFSAVSSYRDVIFCDRNYRNDKYVKQTLTMHLLSHILRNQSIKSDNDIRVKNNEFIADDTNDSLIRDSGFKRLSVLVITPFRENVRKFGLNIVSNLPSARKVRNQRYKKFMDEYGAANIKRMQGRGKAFEETFAGNIDDDFWCGIGIDQKGINFLQNWYYSDIVFISPLRLKLIFDKGKTRDGRSVFDFFSSIEIMIVDGCDIIEMQNITHLFDTLHKINWHPKLKKDEDVKSVNFDRLRYCYIDDVAPFYRQNIFVTKQQTPKIKQLFQQRSQNIFGKIKIENMSNNTGILEKIIPFVRQEFYRFEMSNDKNSECESVNELRLEIYQKYMLSIFRKNSGVKTLIFVSSYYDFLRLRQLNQNVSNIKFLSEYTIKSDASKYRKAFGDMSNGECMYLVMTERYYFYNRLKCEGAKRVLFYSLPHNKEYYSEILNWFDTKAEYESYALYCKNFDNLALQRIVGLKRMIRMLKNKNNKQVFV